MKSDEFWRVINRLRGKSFLSVNQVDYLDIRYNYYENIYSNNNATSDAWSVALVNMLFKKGATFLITTA